MHLAVDRESEHPVCLGRGVVRRDDVLEGHDPGFGMLGLRVGSRRSGERDPQILVDRARYRNAQKRGAGLDNVTLNSEIDGVAQPGEDLLALDDALTALVDRNPRLCQVVECHFFGGLTFKETGEVLGTSERTAERDWHRARAYLRRLMHQDSTDQPGPALND